MEKSSPSHKSKTEVLARLGFFYSCREVFPTLSNSQRPLQPSLYRPPPFATYSQLRIFCCTQVKGVDGQGEAYHVLFFGLSLPQCQAAVSYGSRWMGVVSSTEYTLY